MPIATKITITRWQRSFFVLVAFALTACASHDPSKPAGITTVSVPVLSSPTEAVVSPIAVSKIEIIAPAPGSTVHVQGYQSVSRYGAGPTYHWLYNLGDGMGELVRGTIGPYLRLSPDSPTTASVEVEINYFTGLEENILHRFWNVSAAVTLRLTILDGDDVLFSERFVGLGKDTSSTFLNIAPKQNSMNSTLQDAFEKLQAALTKAQIKLAAPSKST